jgi:hypothetical protein
MRPATPAGVPGLSSRDARIHASARCCPAVVGILKGTGVAAHRQARHVIPARKTSRAR